MNVKEVPIVVSQLFRQVQVPAKPIKLTKSEEPNASNEFEFPENNTIATESKDLLKLRVDSAASRY